MLREVPGRELAQNASALPAALALAADLDLCLCADVDERLPADAVDPFRKWSRRFGEPGPGGDTDRVERMPLGTGQVGHQR